MRRLRIIQTPARFPPARGGVEKYVLELSKQLVAQGSEVVVVCADEPPVGRGADVPVPAVRLPYVGKIANTNITTGLFGTLMREEFDLIHTHIPTPWSADISALVSALKRKPLFVTYHNDLTGQGISKLIAAIYNWTLLHLVLWRAKEIFITQAGYIDYSRHLKLHAKKVSVVPLGVNDPLPTNVKERKQGQILFVSVLDSHHAYKGLDVLINAMVKVKEKRPEARLVVIGDGDLVPGYRKLARALGIADCVDFLGHVPDARLAELYASSAVFVLPSVNKLEGFGIVALEALTYATPVVTTQFAGSARLIAENAAGLIVKSGDGAMLTEAILRLLEDESETRRMGLRGEQAVRSRFSWEGVAQQIADRYCAP